MTKKDNCVFFAETKLTTRVRSFPVFPVLTPTPLGVPLHPTWWWSPGAEEGKICPSETWRGNQRLRKSSVILLTCLERTGWSGEDFWEDPQQEQERE